MESRCGLMFAPLGALQHCNIRHLDGIKLEVADRICCAAAVAECLTATVGLEAITCSMTALQLYLQ